MEEKRQRKREEQKERTRYNLFQEKSYIDNLPLTGYTSNF